MNEERRIYNRFEIPLDVKFSISKGDTDYRGITKNRTMTPMSLPWAMWFGRGKMTIGASWEYGFLLWTREPRPIS
ncbi:MAG: hypothetical protein AMK70_14560 [Nitrospira bacterium SG8_35_1]|nr:MAG: hypothetical protein AMK70_14560 [Nitrospira bacterium SG8_35_1]